MARLLSSSDLAIAGSQGSIATEALGRLKRAMTTAQTTSPLVLPAITSGITVAQAASSDTTLTNIPVAGSNLVNANLLNLVSFYGGIPVGISAATASVALKVGSSAPGNGNLVGYVNTPSNVTADLMQASSTLEFMTDAAAVEIGFLLNNKRLVFLLVNGQYLVDKTTGWTGAGAGNANSFLKITGLTGINRITALFSVDSSAPSVTALAGLRVSPLATVWKPDQQNVLREAAFGDSFVEGVGLAANGNNVFTTPNAPMVQVSAQLLGIRDCRQFGVGGTGYLADNNGTRSKFSAQILKAVEHAPFDLITINHGYNDQAQANATPDVFQAEVLADLGLLRTVSNAPIVVFGSQAGKRGPDAATLLVENRIKAAVSAFGDPLCKFVPVSTDAQPWIAGTGYVGATNASGNSDLYTSPSPDTIHPNQAGAFYLGQRRATAIRAAVNSMYSA